MGEQQADQKPPKRGLSPWLWSSAASVLIIIGLSLYLPELNDPSVERPAMSSSKPIMMHSIGSDKAIELSLSQTQDPTVSPAVTPAPTRQAEPVAAGKVNAAKLAETLQRIIEVYLAQGKRDIARELYQSIAGKFARLADDNPEKRRFVQLGRHLKLVGSP